jgi:phage terminase large subunit-like protein
VRIKTKIMITEKDYLEAKKIVQEYETKHLNISAVRKSSPLKEGWTKSNIKNNTQTRRLAPPPPPMKR